MLDYERKAWAGGHRRVAGLDEAGRGPLAGPVVSAAVCFDADFLKSEADHALKGLTDSKKLSEARREYFFQILCASPSVAFGIGQAEVDEIDAHNILAATHLAMSRALVRITPLPDHVLVDGLPVPGLPCSSTAIVGGDAKSLSIAAASVIAKVTRDRMMLELDARYPGYGFAHHKGYGTKEHLAALRKLGPCSCHRRTFGPVSQMEFSL